MAREYADVKARKITRVKICYKCKSRNPALATKCRKCNYKDLRKKHADARK